MENQMDLFENLSSDNNLPEIQKYIEKVIKIRGFSRESVREKLLCLAEEVGELIKAVRSHCPDGFIDPTHSADYGSVEEELADVFILLVDISNKLNMDLFECLKNKEKINIKRKWVKNSIH